MINNKFSELSGKVAIITGASRGIGRACALALAKQGIYTVIAAKSTQNTDILPGTIYSVSEECSKYTKSLPYQLDLRYPETAKECIDFTVKNFGNVDILINNASALWWKSITKTPLSKYDLINNVNAKGSFAMVQACLPYMEDKNWGHIINMSPPITIGNFSNKTAYYISKYGMSLVALGVAHEYEGKGIAGNTLWPATIIESFASINHNLGNEKMWRKPEIIADAVLNILLEDPKTFTGNMLIDEHYLRSKGITDFIKYRCHPDFEPPMLDLFDNETNSKL